MDYKNDSSVNLAKKGNGNCDQSTSGCGFGPWRPRCLQIFAKPIVFLILLNIYCIVEGTIVSGKTVMFIERSSCIDYWLAATWLTRCRVAIWGRTSVLSGCESQCVSRCVEAISLTILHVTLAHATGTRPLPEFTLLCSSLNWRCAVRVNAWGSPTQLTMYRYSYLSTIVCSMLLSYECWCNMDSLDNYVHFGLGLFTCWYGQFI